MPPSMVRYLKTNSRVISGVTESNILSFLQSQCFDVLESPIGQCITPFHLNGYERYLPLHIRASAVIICRYCEVRHICFGNRLLRLDISPFHLLWPLDLTVHQSYDFPVSQSYFNFTSIIWHDTAWINAASFPSKWAAH